MAKGAKGWATKLALGAGAFALVLSLPNAVAAFGVLDDVMLEDGFNARGSLAAFTPASIDPRLAEFLANRSDGKARMMRFTPAGASSWGDSRSVTVAVRIDSQAAQAIGGLGSSDGAGDAAGTNGGLRITSTRYNLGLARGYRSFAQAPALSATLSAAQIPDLADFGTAPGANDEPGRFAARVELEPNQAAAIAHPEPARLGDRLLDVSGSFRLTRNLDVTAGVRYQQDRDLRPLPDIDQQDSQAVYIGTQFRF